VYIALGLIGLTFLAALAWRLAARRRSLPCPEWLRWLVELDNPLSKTYGAAAIVQHMALAPGMKVLDAGCGPGRLTIPVAQAVGPQGEVAAIDIQPGMLRRAQAKAQGAGLHNIRFRLAGLGEGQLERNYFDRALLVTVLGEIPDRQSALAEIFSALKPGGLLSVTEIVFDPHYQRKNTVRSLAAEASFVEKQIYGDRFGFTLNLEKPGGAQGEPAPA
jgi:ubiquinone/menaquinone biosynthesis C-methylase UbiE